MDINTTDYDQTVVTFGNIYFTAPKRWNDLTLKQQLVCHDVLMNLTPTTLVQRRIGLMQFLTGITDEVMQAWHDSFVEAKAFLRLDAIDADYEIDPAAYFAEDLKKTVEAVTGFLFAPPTPVGGEYGETPPTGVGGLGIAANLTQCPYPTVELWRKRQKKAPVKVTLYAASDGLANMTFSEMAQVFTIFEQFMKTGDVKLVDRALATIYRPSKPNDAKNRAIAFEGDRRTPLEESEAVIEQRMKMWLHVRPEAKRLLWFWIVSCREQIIRQNPQIFKSGNSDALMKRLAVYSWAGVAIELSKGDVLARKAIETANYKDIFITLSYLETKAEVTEERLKN